MLLARTIFRAISQTIQLSNAAKHFDPCLHFKLILHILAVRVHPHCCACRHNLYVHVVGVAPHGLRVGNDSTWCMIRLVCPEHSTIRLFKCLI